MLLLQGAWLALIRSCTMRPGSACLAPEIWFLRVRGKPTGVYYPMFPPSDPTVPRCQPITSDLSSHQHSQPSLDVNPPFTFSSHYSINAIIPVTIDYKLSAVPSCITFSYLINASSTSRAGGIPRIILFAWAPLTPEYPGPSSPDSILQSVPNSPYSGSFP